MTEARIEVRLRPGARVDELLGMRDGVLQARVVAPPVDGRANKALCRLVAKRVGVPPSRVSLERVAKSRDKLLRVAGVETARLERALGG